MIAPERHEPRRIAIVLHSLDRGGSGRVAGYLARGFAQAGHAVELLLIAGGGATDPEVASIAGSAVSIRRQRRSAGWRPADLALGLPALVGALRRSRPHVVIAAANNVAVPVTAAVRLAGLRDALLFLKTTNPVVGSRHAGALGQLRLAGYRAAFGRADGVWTLSPQETTAMRQAFGDRDRLFRDVLNPYVTAAMLAVPDGPTARREGKTVIAVARLVYQKRLERLLAGFARAKTPGTRLLILGEGEERARLAALASSLSIDDRIDMPGQVANVAAVLHVADLLVLTSDYEGLPAVVLEAMAANCPVMSTDCFPAARAMLAGAPGCGIIDDFGPDALGAQIDCHLALPRPTTLRAAAEHYAIENGVRDHLAAIFEGEHRRRRLRAKAPHRS